MTSGVDVANSMMLRTKQTVAGDGSERWALRIFRMCRTIARGQPHRSSSVYKPQTWNCCQAKADEFFAVQDKTTRRAVVEERPSRALLEARRQASHEDTETCAG